MTMKATRHAKILELIQNHTVTTQEEMQSLLEANHSPRYPRPSPGQGAFAQRHLLLYAKQYRTG